MIQPGSGRYQEGRKDVQRNCKQKTVNTEVAGNFTIDPNTSKL